MRTLVIGCNFRTAPVSVRERLSFDEAGCRDALRSLRWRYPCSESVILSTCNRVEMYVSRLANGHPRVKEAIQFLAGVHDVSPADFSESVYHYEDSEAVRHLFRVVSSLDSMVLGESEILSQAKSALAMARDEFTSGRFLDGLFQHAFQVAKQVHTQTGISEGRVSVASVAVDFSKQIFSRFDDKTVLMIGAGEMGEATLQHLITTGPQRIWITNRTAERATALADRFGGEAKPYKQLTDLLVEADVVITSVGAKEPILTGDNFKDIPARRQYRPLQIIDISVPRSVADPVGQHDGVFLYNIDELQRITEASVVERRGEIQRCQEIIELNVREFEVARGTRDVGAMIQDLEAHVRAIGQEELDWLLPKLNGISEKDRALLGQMIHRVTRKLVHHPTRTLHDNSDGGRAGIYLDALRTLFDLKSRD
jgi:glutamyl-tRNA reductase